MVLQPTAVIEFTQEELDALHGLLFDTCLYTTSKQNIYGNRISAANKLFKAKEHLDGVSNGRKVRAKSKAR